ncbi:hypothetical protein [Nitratireductor sp. XY-223]|uniref:helix-turn-helix transcriptional regulator n=1 Tax=Nitratireductor sp. XY-223 TaxID=2561926 RepID=UPI0010AA409C|nr:hypothetical protein [Nitratireductor sp. XY-223]
MKWINDTELPDIVAGFWDAAAQPDEWSRVLQSASEILHAEGAIIINHAPEGGSYYSSPRMKAMMEEFFSHNWVNRNPWPQRIMRKRLNKDAVTEWLLFSREELNRLEVYNDWTLKNGFCGSLATIINSDDGIISFDCGRTIAQGPFGEKDVAQFRKIIPAMRNAAYIGKRISEARDAGAGDIVDQMSCGALLIDNWGRTVRANAAGERHVRDAFETMDGRLVPKHPGARDRFKAECNRALRALWTSQVPLSESQAITLMRQDSRPLVARIFPVYGAMNDILRRARLLMIIVDPDEEAYIEADVLQNVFGMTRSEAEVCLDIARGVAPAQIAAVRRVSVHTIRRQVKSAFMKTGTRRQPELAALIGRLTNRLS